MAAPVTLDAETVRRLRYVKVETPSLDIGRFPDFLIIGPQRTGTTWLHANLREHPEVFLSEPKELFYFSRLKPPAGAHKPREVRPDLEWYLKFFRETPLRYAYKQGFALLHHRRAYRPRTRGEATATYAALDRDVIADIAALKPGIKAVMMVRDPVARAWSHAKKDLARNVGRSLSEVGDRELERFFRDPYQLRCARYAENLTNWQAELGRDHVFVGRFEDIETRPVDLMCDVMRFLGISAEPRLAGRSVYRTVNPTGGSDIPERCRRLLEGILAEEIRSWKDRFRRDPAVPSPGPAAPPGP